MIRVLDIIQIVLVGILFILFIVPFLLWAFIVDSLQSL